eukprot:scaffold38298_cov49-Attheya_sp.AAC.5
MLPTANDIHLKNKSIPLSILSRLGVSEDDIRTGEILSAEIPPLGHWESLTKDEKLLGYSKSRLKREKALKILGVTEDEIEVENRKRLGALGNKDRKRRISTAWSFQNLKMNLIRGHGACVNTMRSNHP